MTETPEDFEMELRAEPRLREFQDRRPGAHRAFAMMSLRWFGDPPVRHRGRMALADIAERFGLSVSRVSDILHEFTAPELLRRRFPPAGSLVVNGVLHVPVGCLEDGWRDMAKSWADFYLG